MSMDEKEQASIESLLGVDVEKRAEVFEFGELSVSRIKKQLANDVTAEESGDLQNICDFGGFSGFFGVMDIGNDRDVVSFFDFGKNF